MWRGKPIDILYQGCRQWFWKIKQIVENTFILSYVPILYQSLSVSSFPSLLFGSTLLWIKGGHLEAVSCFSSVSTAQLVKVCFRVFLCVSLRILEITPATATYQVKVRNYAEVHFISLIMAFFCDWWCTLLLGNYWERGNSVVIKKWQNYCNGPHLIRV